MNYFVMGDILLFPVIPEIILAIPLSNNPNDKKIITIANANPGIAKNTNAKITTMIPNTRLAILDALPSPLDAAPDAIRPAP